VHGNPGIGIPNRDYYIAKCCAEKNRKYLKENDRGDKK
jgi:hypothetical protein